MIKTDATSITLKLSSAQTATFKYADIDYCEYAVVWSRGDHPCVKIILKDGTAHEFDYAIYFKKLHQIMASHKIDWRYS